MARAGGAAAAVLAAVLALQLLLAPVEARTASRRHDPDHPLPPDFVFVMKIILAVLLVPPIAGFVWYTARDPITPHIVLELWLRTKVRAAPHARKCISPCARVFDICIAPHTRMHIAVRAAYSDMHL